MTTSQLPLSGSASLVLFAVAISLNAGCADDDESSVTSTTSGTTTSAGGSGGSSAGGSSVGGSSVGGSSAGGSSAGGSAAGGSGGGGGSGNGTAMSFFVSSTSPSTNEDGNLGGLAGADAHCKALALAVNAVRTQWVAYLSTEGDTNNPNDDIHARDRIGTGPWYNADGQTFAPNLNAIHTIETSIIACDPGPQTCLQDRAAYILVKPADALFLDETGLQVTDPLQGGGRGHDIFTGSDPDGTVFAGGTCNDWTSTANSAFARVGHTDAPNNTQFSPSWNSAHDTVSCSSSGVASRGGAGFVYCFATD
jgi:hypothetical protein